MSNVENEGHVWSSRSAKRVFATLVTFAVVAAGCSPAPAPVSQSPIDPSNPSASAGMTPTTAAAPPQAPATAAGAEHAGHAHGSESTPHQHGASGAASAVTDAAAASVTYVCPMHPEVTSTAPGVCPKCNMKLVPKK